jgi:hypothetical protein
MIILPTTGHGGDQITISGSGDKFFRISDVRFGGVYTSGVTGYQPTGVDPSGAPTGVPLSGGLNILVSGVSADFDVVNPNTINVSVPAMNTFTGQDQRTKWANYGYPTPITIISEERKITGYASGSTGELFRPIPFIDKVTPLSGISGQKVYVEGDNLLGVSGLKLINVTGYSLFDQTSGIEKYLTLPTGVAEVTGFITGVTGYSSFVTGYDPTGLGITGALSGFPTGTPLSGSGALTDLIPVTGMVYNTGNYYTWQSPTGVYEDLEARLTIYLPFETINNTGITFELPSGNFYGNVQVCASGEAGKILIESNLSSQKIQPEVEITGFWPQVGFSGEPLTISGRYFLPELLGTTEGSFVNQTGGYSNEEGYLLVFGGSGASGVFHPKSGAGITELTGYVPATARTGPVKIKQNDNIAGFQTPDSPAASGGFFVSDISFPVYVGAPEPTRLQGLNNSNVPLAIASLVETGTIPTFDITGTGLVDATSGTALFEAGRKVKEYTITGFLTSGIFGQESGVTGYNQVFQSGFTGFVVTGLEGPTGGTGDQAGFGVTGYISGMVETSGGFFPMGVTGITKTGIMTGITFASGFSLDVGFFESTSTVDFSTSLGREGAQSLNLSAKNFFSSGVQTGSALNFKGVEKAPITLYYPIVGPDIEECLEDYQIKKDRGDSPIYYLDGCEQAFMLYYSGSYANFDIKGGSLQPDLLQYFVSSQAASSALEGITSAEIAADNPSLSASQVAASLEFIEASAPEGVDQYTTTVPQGGGGTGNLPPGDGGPTPTATPILPPNPFGGLPKPPTLVQVPLDPPPVIRPGAPTPTYCGYTPSLNQINSIAAPVARPYKNADQSAMPIRTTKGVGTIYKFGGAWGMTELFEKGKPSIAKTPEEKGDAPLGYNRLNLAPIRQYVIKSVEPGKPQFTPSYGVNSRLGLTNKPARRIINTPNPNGTNGRIDCGGTRPVDDPPRPSGPLQPLTENPHGNPGPITSIGNPPDPCADVGNPVEVPVDNDDGQPQDFAFCGVGMPIYRPGEFISIPSPLGINVDQSNDYELQITDTRPIEEFNQDQQTMMVNGEQITVVSCGFPVEAFGPEDCPENKPPITSWPHPRAPIPKPPGNPENPNPENPPAGPCVLGPINIPTNEPPTTDPPWTPPPREPSGTIPIDDPPVISCGPFPPAEIKPPINPTGIKGTGINNTISGFWIVPYPSLDFGVANQCSSHAVQTGSSGYYLYDQNLKVAVEQTNTYWTPVPRVDNQHTVLSRTFFGASGVEPIFEPDGSVYFDPDGTPLSDFLVENSGALRLNGGYIQTEASSGFNFVDVDDWSVQFWINHKQFYEGLKYASFNTKDVALFGISGQHPSENGNTFFHIGYERHSGAAGITNKVRPYADLSGIDTIYDENLATGWFPESGTYRHFAFVKNTTGYGFFYDGCQLGVSIEATGLDKYLPSGLCKFFFGGLSTGNFVTLNTGWNQYQAPTSSTDFQLDFENNLNDSGKYEQTLISGGNLVFQTTDARIGSSSLCMDGSSYLETTGSNFNYGTGNFTVECFVYPSGATKGYGTMGNSIQTLWMIGQTSSLDGANHDFATGNGVALLLDHNKESLRLLFDYDDQYLFHDLVSPYNNTQLKTQEWNHVALCRSGTTFYSYINGEPAGAVVTEDFAANYYTKTIYTGMPVIDATGQNLYIGGAMSGAVSTTNIIDTGTLYESQPYKYEHLVNTLSGLVTTGFASGATGSAAGYIIDAEKSGYEYTVKTDGTLWANAKVTAYWGGQISDEKDHGVVLCQWIHNRDGSTDKFMIEQGFNVGGQIQGNTLGFDKDTQEAQKQNQSVVTKPKYGIFSQNDYFPMYNPEGTSRVFCTQTLAVQITGLKAGDKVNFFAPRYNNALPQQPYDMELSANNGWFTENNQFNQMFIESLQFHESKLENYCGLIDQFIVSNECKYSSDPVTGSFESGYLDTDLGPDVYVKELNVRTDAIFSPDNGKYHEPTSAPVSGSGTASILNFETVIDLSNIINNGITGDSQYARTYKTHSGENNVRFSANGEGKYGNYAMNFPTGNVSVPNTGGTLFTENVKISTGNFTVEMWVKPSGTAYLTSLGSAINDDLKRQTLISFGTTGSGFNFFISGGQDGNHLGLDLYNGGRITGFEPEGAMAEPDYVTPTDLTRLYVMGGYDTILSSGSNYNTWNSGDWNHIAFVRHNKNIMAYMNGYFAGMVNFLGENTDGPGAYSNSSYIDRSTMITPVDQGGAGVNFGDLSVNSSLVTIGGGSYETPNFEGQIDAFNFTTGVTGAMYTNIFSAPRPWVTCDSQNELVCHFQEPHGFWSFYDDHCCPTGITGYERTRYVDDSRKNDYMACVWGDTVTLKGRNFYGVTGVLLGDAEKLILNSSGQQWGRGKVSASSTEVAKKELASMWSEFTSTAELQGNVAYSNVVEKWRVVDNQTIQFVVPPDSVGSNGISIVGHTTKHRKTVVTTGIDYDGDGNIDKVQGYRVIRQTSGVGYEIYNSRIDLRISPPAMDIIDFSPISGYTNENITIRGKSLHYATKLMISGQGSDRLELPFTGVGSTGIVFTVPDKANMESHIQVFANDGQEALSTDKLRILNSGIKSFTPETGVYNETVIFSGSYFESGVDIVLFPSYQVGNVDGPDYHQQNFTPGLNISYIDETGISVKVPNGVVKGFPIISGSGNGMIISGSTEFVPIPTISGIEKTITKVGCSFRMTGINASNLVPLIGFTGNSLQPYTQGDGVIEFIANTGDSAAYTSNQYPPVSEFGIDRNSTGIYSKVFYFGKLEVDKTHLEANLPLSAQTGYVIVSGTLNNQIIGSGNPFLISRHETFNTGNGNKFDNYYNISGLNIDSLRSDFINLRDTYALQNISNVTGDHMIISGRTPFITGITPTRGDGGVILEISGLYGLNVTGVKFIPVSTPSVECHMNSGEFIPQKTIINSVDPISNNTVVRTVTGWHFKNVYTGNGQYIDVGDQVQVYGIYPCEELRNFGSVDILLMYDSGITTTGLC